MRISSLDMVFDLRFNTKRLSARWDNIHPRFLSGLIQFPRDYSDACESFSVSGLLHALWYLRSYRVAQRCESVLTSVSVFRAKQTKDKLGLHYDPAPLDPALSDSSFWLRHGR
jgi:hypothetical protein